MDEREVWDRQKELRRTNAAFEWQHMLFSKSATVTQALTCEVGPCVVSIAWKGQKHIQTDLRSQQPFSIMAYTFKATPGQADGAACESSSQQKGSFCACTCRVNAY